jgi:hypothetical protein
MTVFTFHKYPVIRLRKRAFVDGRVRTRCSRRGGGGLNGQRQRSGRTGAVAASRSHVWGTGIEVPGTAALNQGGFADSGGCHTSWRDRV